MQGTQHSLREAAIENPFSVLVAVQQQDRSQQQGINLPVDYTLQNFAL